jgi:hypothetical protein
MPPKDPIHAVLSKNRAEEIGHDVWEQFVIPPFFDNLEIFSTRKPKIIIAGRGCGKTMLLRYLSHQSAFSPRRPHIPDEAYSHIGLYWRADTQFTNAMTKRSIPDDVWQSAFNHLLALVLGEQLLESLRSIALSRATAINQADLESLTFDSLAGAYEEFPHRYVDLRKELRRQLLRFQAWVNDARKQSEPTFLPGHHFLIALVSAVREAVPSLAEAIYAVYIDEYENLLPYQKETIHTALKHSEAAHGLIFNLAAKRNVMEGRRTTGTESLANIHDWRYHDIEHYLRDAGFELFAAEIIFLKLALVRVEDVPIDVPMLRDPNRLSERRTADYVSRVLATVERMFPHLTEEGLADEVFREDALLNRLKRRIQRALVHRGSNAKPALFLAEDQRKAAIIMPALLSRQSLTVDEILTELSALRAGVPNKFSSQADWVHNNFIGSLLQLYDPYSRACPFYAGFARFCEMSEGSIRHILELCHQSIQQARRDGQYVELLTTPMQQASAARLASALFLNEVRKFGPFGNQLYNFVLRLGSVFALAQERDTQSEPEVSHFALSGGDSELDPTAARFIDEAIKWSVLFEEKATKRKDPLDLEGSEYVLNPIYAPYFHISYRKRRRLDLTAAEFRALTTGSYDDFARLLRRYAQGWKVDVNDRPSLFAHLEEEPTA